MIDHDPRQELAPASLALRGLCPRCGKGKLFRGWVRFAERCSACDLSFSQFNVGDGPAAFLILIVGAVVTVGALVTDAVLEPPWWVHLVWVPVAVLLTAPGLRLGKILLLAQEYQHKAREGQIVQ
ncbi:DUF983 domain-containing protein [Sphingomonas sp. GCM10030256]|uniref:DUF983 domain-containing protein n=1 Tax=Sphingomonas sp. GCM10030256 TaxID=3273427 RepID=UPI0036089675